MLKKIRKRFDFSPWGILRSPPPGGKEEIDSVRTAGSWENKMAAARCVRGLWTNQVLSRRISSRLIAQPASLFSSESGKIFRGSRTFNFLKMALYQPYCSLCAVVAPMKKHNFCQQSPGICMQLQKVIRTPYSHASRKEGRSWEFHV